VKTRALLVLRRELAVAAVAAIYGIRTPRTSFAFVT